MKRQIDLHVAVTALGDGVVAAHVAGADADCPGAAHTLSLVREVGGADAAGAGGEEARVVLDAEAHSQIFGGDSVAVLLLFVVCCFLSWLSGGPSHPTFIPPAWHRCEQSPTPSLSCAPPGAGRGAGHRHHVTDRSIPSEHKVGEFKARIEIDIAPPYGSGGAGGRARARGIDTTRTHNIGPQTIAYTEYIRSAARRRRPGPRGRAADSVDVCLYLAVVRNFCELGRPKPSCQ